jgi:hypothetical protein
MTYKGTVKHGVIVLEGGVELQDGTKVRVEPVAAPKSNGGKIPTLAERLKNVIGKAEGLPPDMAENHDHYIHGTPKREK